MRGTAPTAKAPGAAGPVYIAGSANQGPRVPDAEVEPAYQWIKERFGTNENYAASRKRDHAQRDGPRPTNLTRGKRNKTVMK